MQGDQRQGGAGVSFRLQAARCVKGQITHLVAPHRNWATFAKPLDHCSCWPWYSPQDPM